MLYYQKKFSFNEEYNNNRSINYGPCVWQHVLQKTSSRVLFYTESTHNGL